MSVVDVQGVPRKLVWAPSPHDPRDLHYAAGLDKTPQQKGFAVANRSDLSVLSPAIMDQGQLGSCTAHGTIACVAGVRRKEGLAEVDLARLFLYWTERVLLEGRDPGDDSGAYVRDALKAVATYGLPPERDWPYDITKFADRPPRSVFDEALQRRAIRYYSLSTLEWIKSCLTLGYPTVFGFSVPESFPEEAGRTGQALMPRPGEPFVGGHCVAAFGHDDARINEPGDVGALRCANSWGTGWGDDGWFWLPYSYVTNWLATDFWTVHAQT